MRFKTSMLKSNSYDYSDACIVMKGTLTAESDNDDKKRK